MMGNGSGPGVRLVPPRVPAARPPSGRARAALRRGGRGGALGRVPGAVLGVGGAGWQWSFVRCAIGRFGKD